MKRREFLSLSAKSIGGVLAYTLLHEPLRLQAKEGTVRVPLRFFTADEARTVKAACERIFPSDASGPGAGEAGVVIYIDRQLAGPYGKDAFRYTKGPWVEDKVGPEFGYQGRQSPRDIYRQGIALLGNFADLDVEKQIAKLHSIENSPFFRMLRQHTIEGMFCDPMHGGNADKIGWQLIGFPGPPETNYANDITKHYGEAWRPKPMSLKQVYGYTQKPLEDEKM